MTPSPHGSSAVIERKESSTTCGTVAADRSPSEAGAGSVQSSQPRPHRATDAIELTPVDDAWHVATGVIARVGNAAEPDSRDADLGVRPVVACVVCACPRRDIVAPCRRPHGIPEPGASFGCGADRHVAGGYTDPIE